MTGAGPAEPPVAGAADIAAIEAAGWPADLPATTYEVFRRAAERFGDATALSFFLAVDDHRRTRDCSYRALFAEVTRAANVFTRLGVGPADVVAYVLPNLPETHFALWGAEAAGRALAVNPLLDADGIADILRAAKAKVVVTLAPFPTTDIPARALAAARAAETVTDVVLVDLADHVSGWKRIPARLMSLRARRGVPGAGRPRLHRYGRLAAAAPPDRLLRAAAPAAGDVSSLFPTGGTTGRPKLAVRTHANEVANAWMASRMAGDAAKPGDTAFCGLPLFHVNAALVTGLAAFLRGARVLLGTPQGYRAPGMVDRFWEIVEHHRVASFSGVPTLYAALLQKPAAGRNLSSLRYCYCGAAPMPADAIRAFEALTGVPMLEGYGLTEGTCVSSVNPLAGERRPGSVGLALPFGPVRALLRDASGAFRGDAAPGEAGAICISGPNVFSGYLGGEDSGSWVDRGDGRRWFDTGDLGRIDADGYVWLTGRAKDLIIRGGHNIDPATIEDALYRHPAVELAAAVGRPDPYAGELPVVYVQLRAGAAAAEAELLAFAEAQVGERAARPKAVRVLDRLPQTAVGKIFKPTLREMETRRFVEDALAGAGIAATATAAVDPRRGMVATVAVPPDRVEEARAALAGTNIAVEFASARAPGGAPGPG